MGTYEHGQQAPHRAKYKHSLGFNEKDAPSKWRYVRPALFGTAIALIFGLSTYLRPFLVS